MKKFLLVILAFALCSSSVFAKNADNLLVIRDTQVQELALKLRQVLEEPTIKDDVLYSIKKNYFIRLYQSDNDVNIFLNCDKTQQDQYQSKLKSLGYKAFAFADKDLQNKYSSDFSNYIELNNIVIGDVKTNKNSYNPYNKPLKNRVIKTTKYSENGVDFKTNQVQMQTKLKRYVDGFEIIVYNNTDNNILLKKVETGDFVGLSEIAKKAAIPAGVDFIPIYGIVAGAKTDIEKNKFTRPFPTNYTIKKGENVRLLGLAKLQVAPIIDFTFAINGKEKVIQLHTYR